MAPNIELSRRSFIGLVCIIIATLAVIMAFIYLPSARITLSPATEIRSVEQEITLSSETTTPNFVTYVLPARVVSKELEKSQTITREGAQSKDDFAKGVVTLINEQDEEQPLLPQTHLRHEATGVQFLTDNAVRIPPQGELTVSVTAKEQGASGNVPPGKFIVDKLPAAAQQVIYGRSDQAFVGGTVTDSAVTEDEITRAREDITTQLREQAFGELTLEAGGAAISPDLITIETIEEAISAQPGSFTTTFSVRIKIQARAFVVEQNDLLSLSLIALRASATNEEEFVSYEPDSFKPTIIQVDFARGRARIAASLTGSFAKKIEPSVLTTKNIAGLGQKEVVAYFEEFPSVGKATVTFSPFWVSSVPSRPSAVEIEIASN